MIPECMGGGGVRKDSGVKLRGLGV